MTMNAILITNVDSLLGYALAYRFLEEWNRRGTIEAFREKTEFRLLCRERQGMEELERMGAKVIEVPNYTDPNMVRPALRDVSYMMLLPENDQTAFPGGQMMIEQAKKANVDYVALFSYQGIDHVEKHKHQFASLYPFFQLEQELQKVYDKNNYCIFRSGMWHQFFYYFGPMISDKSKVQLPIRKDSRWTSVDLGDLLDAVYNLSAGEESSEQQRQFNALHTSFAGTIVTNLKRKNQNVFCFTGEETITPHHLTRIIEKGLEHSVQFEQVDAVTLQEYLREIHNDNRFRSRPSSTEKLPFDQQQEGSHSIYQQQSNNGPVTRASGVRRLQSSHHNHYTFPLGRYLNDHVIQGLIEFWQLADTGHTEETTHDLKKALGRKAQSLENFFEKNRDQFRRLR